LVTKRFFVLSIFFVFLISTVFSATITDNTPTVIDQQSNAQSFAQINVRITELANQINAMRTQDQNFQANVFMKSDLQNLYDNAVAINKQSEQAIILDNIIIVVLAFCIFFILIGKGLLPQNSKPKEKKEVKINSEDQAILPELELV
jgi:predicted PurR-regulated permease PerM